MAARNPPVWDFEAFRSFLPYEIMQPAANVLSLFDGCGLDDRAVLRTLNEELYARTGLTWTPERESGPLEYSEEGSLFRNKARLLASLFICVSPEIQRQSGQSPSVRLLPFGRSLALGHIDRHHYYDFIISRYRYPHPAFDSYDDWAALGIVCHPFLLILRVLLQLHSIGPEDAWLGKSEIVNCLMAASDDGAADVIAHAIVAMRLGATPTEDAGFPEIATRKAGDMMAFLAMSRHALLGPRERLHLNVVGRHTTERTHYLEERSGRGLYESSIATTRDLVERTG